MQCHHFLSFQPFLLKIAFHHSPPLPRQEAEGKMWVLADEPKERTDSITATRIDYSRSGAGCVDD